MIIVADSSPLVVLVSIGHVDVLPALFPGILIPPQVEAELASAKRPELVRAFIAEPPPWIRIQHPSSLDRIEGLHAGETAAISLARDVGADLVIIDERLGRKMANERGLQVVGTIGVLEVAADRGLIDLGDAFRKVKGTDFWVSPAFLDERLASFLARKQARELTPEG
jgi:predicted nucleic acid-binding protein